MGGGLGIVFPLDMKYGEQTSADLKDDVVFLDLYQF